MTDHQSWLEEPYEHAGEEVSGETNIGHLGLSIDVIIENNEVASYKIVGIDDDLEARACADHAAEMLGVAPATTEAEIMDLIARAHLPHTIDAEECIKLIVEDDHEHGRY
jgi:hypothetical protein